MLRRRLLTPAMAVLLSGSASLAWGGSAGLAWAGPPPPPPPSNPDEPIDAPPSGPPSNGSPVNEPPPPPTTGKANAQPKSDPLVIDQRTPETDLGGNWTYSRGGASGPNYVRGAEEEELFLAVNPIGYYQGVSVTSGNLPPYAPKEIGGESAVLTWTGFERGDASSRVFFQLSATVEPEISVEGMRVFVKFPRTSVTTRNNQRKLITRFFKTPVNEVSLSRSGKDMVAVLDLRWEATPIWRFETGANGYRVLVFEFSDTQDQVLTDTDTTTPTDGDTSGGPKPPAPPGPFLPTK